MKIGVHVGHVVFKGYDLQQQWLNQLEEFRLARDVGFDFLGWGHHWMIDPFQHFQPIPVLSRFAAEAGSMEMVTSVLLTPILNPVQVAEEIATLDHLCEGKFIFGVGLGYRKEEFEAAGMVQKERAPRFEEGLELMKKLWTQDVVSHKGTFYTVSEARPTARPFQKPYPRIWIGGMTEAPIKRAGRLGHSYYALPLTPYAEIKHNIGIWHEALDAHNHPIPTELPVIREVFIAPTREKAIQKAKPSIEQKYAGYKDHSLPLVGSAIASGVEPLYKDPFAVGDPGDCLESLAKYRDLGVTHLELRLSWPATSHKEVLEMTELVGKTILHPLKKL